MMQHELVHHPSGTVIAGRAFVANSFWERTKGLLGRSTLGADEVLILPRCRMVHMFGMRFAIDLLFCSTDGVVLGLQSELRPWHVSRYVGDADHVIETPPGFIAAHSIALGDRLEVRTKTDLSDFPPDTRGSPPSER